MINIEIRIDTKKDSHEDIKKVIGFLQNFIEKTRGNQPLSEGAFNMFSENPNTPSQDISQASTGINKEDEKDDDDFDISPMIEPY